MNFENRNNNNNSRNDYDDDDDDDTTKSGKSLNIAVIGGGPVGSLCACYLANHGHKVFLYEGREDIRTTELSKGRSVNLAISARGRAALKKIGLEREIIYEHGLPMIGRMIHDKNGTKNIIPYDEVGKQCIYSSSRKYVNELLLTAAEREFNVMTSFKTKLISLDSKKGIMKFTRTDTNEFFETTADVIIGADGAYSTVRKEFLKHPMFNYSQEYIEHGYVELSIPPDIHGQFLMEPNYLHIWPRDTFMMIALPNRDKSWTVTLFMPLKNFQELKKPETLLKFFQINFPDALNYMTEDGLIRDYFSTVPSHLVSIKCNPYHLKNKLLLIGDAAHAMVPFFGQGMNAGFEDCVLLENLVTKYKSDFNFIMPEFSKTRCRDAEAICDLAMYNYIEMRFLVNKKTFRLRKKLDNVLYKIFQNKWLPLYNSVTFTDMNYSKCIENRKFQDKNSKDFS
ncbi:Kynurenine 3-monooxygenase, putative [Pediculus humanus corporis]|uniref:Kynurenine 3-monooxygenase n=1 Tax=Pediculus humanus subsp. corporis TaxID=121224 RepID=E0VU04_PEDHC|nr:Kynurenine 3-monooxygenase, putative [Pediculus humanus corporis]EEB16860.1 Kynurenine 3-monooxygenase, putative [Pediculus humanus corporis]